MVVKRKKAKKKKRPTPKADPQFEKLIQQALSCVGDKNTQPDQTVYTEKFFRTWIPVERAKRAASFDYNADYDQLSNLAIWDHREVAGVLFGVTWDGFTHMAEIIRRGGVC